MTSFVRRVTRVVKSSEIPTLQGAITTADEIVKHLASKEKPMEISSLEPLALEHFLHESQSQVRAVNAVNWLNKNLQLGWPLDKVEKPCVKKTSHIGMECNQALTAQPSMLRALEERLIAAADNKDPTWLAPVASWLQAMGNLRLVHVTRRSVPVELFSDWILFFCKRGKQQHNRSGFYWGAPGKTASTKENSTAVQCASGHPANTDATAEDPLDRQEHRSGTCKTTTTEDFMDQAAEQTFQRQSDAATSSQASRSDSSAPVDDTISTCMQCEFGPGTEGPLGLFCRKCALELSESGIQIYSHA